MKKITVVLMTIIISIGLLSNVSLGIIKSNQDKELQNLIKKYNLKVVTKVPKGIKPLKIDNAATLAKEIDKIKNANKTIDVPTIPNFAPFPALSPSRNGRGTGTQIGHIYFTVVCRFNIETSYNWETRGTERRYFIKAYDVDSYTSGLDTGLEWQQKSYTSSLKDGGRTLSVSVRGRMEHYLLIDGLIRLWTTYPTYTCKFKNP